MKQQWAINYVYKDTQAVVTPHKILCHLKVQQVTHIISALKYNSTKMLKKQLKKTIFDPKKIPQLIHKKEHGNAWTTISYYSTHHPLSCQPGADWLNKQAFTGKKVYRSENPPLRVDGGGGGLVVSPTKGNMILIDQNSFFKMTNGLVAPRQRVLCFALSKSVCGNSHDGFKTLYDRKSCAVRLDRDKVMWPIRSRGIRLVRNESCGDGLMAISRHHRYGNERMVVRQQACDDLSSWILSI